MNDANIVIYRSLDGEFDLLSTVKEYLTVQNEGFIKQG